MSVQVIQGDCLDVFREQPDDFDAFISDLPAGIAFMGRKWDALPMADRKAALAREDAFSEYWAERFELARNRCKPDALCISWALPKTSDLTRRALRLAGWEIVTSVYHLFGGGMMKAGGHVRPAAEEWIVARKGRGMLDVEACRVERGGESTARPSGAHRNAYGVDNRLGMVRGGGNGSLPTNLILSHCDPDGGLGCRRIGRRKVKASGIVTEGQAPVTKHVHGKSAKRSLVTHSDGTGLESLDAFECVAACDCGATWLHPAGGAAPRCQCGRLGWWACPVAEIDAHGAAMGVHSAGFATTGKTRNQPMGSRIYGNISVSKVDYRFGDDGGCSRFFERFYYVGKASTRERDAGCEHLLWRVEKRDPFGYVPVEREEWEALPAELRASGNVHPTVKRIALMRYIHRLSGAKKIGDLCAGSGSGAIAAHVDGLEYVGAEVSPYAKMIADARLSWWRGLAPEALRRFANEDDVPVPEQVDERQRSLF